MPVFLFRDGMKRIFRIVLLFFLLGGFGAARDSRQFLCNVDLLGLPLPVEVAGISPGLSLSTNTTAFPYVNINIPFGGRYYFHSALAAAKDPEYALPLIFLQLGIGTEDLLKEGSAAFYSTGVNVRHFRSRHYENLTVAGALMLGWERPAFRLAAGLDLSTQHHQIRDAALFPLRDERIYALAPKIAFYSRFGNIILTAGSGVFVAGLSWTLNPE